MWGVMMYRLRMASPWWWVFSSAVVAAWVLSSCASDAVRATARPSLALPQAWTATAQPERLTETPQPTAILTAAPTIFASTPGVPPRLSGTAPLYFSWIGSADSWPRWAVTSWHDGRVPDASYHLLHSDDNGRTWSEVTPPQPVSPEDLRTTMIFVHAVAGEPDQAWALFVNPRRPTSLIWRTKDAGNTWKAASFQPRGNLWGGAPWMAMPDLEQGWLLDSYFLGASSSDSDIHRTHDGGATWETLIRRSDSSLAPVLGFDALNSEIAWAVSGSGPGFLPPYELHMTSDGGLSWTDLELGPSTFPDQSAYDCDVSSPHVVSSLVGRVIRQCSSSAGPSQTFVGTTSDGGQSWRYRQVPGPPIFLGDRLAWAVAPSAEAGTPGAPADSVFHSDDGGVTWQAIGQVPLVESIGFPSFERGWAIEDGSLLASYDGGRTWGPQNAHLAAPGPAVDATNWFELPTDLSSLMPSNAGDIELLSELEVPLATSLGAGAQSVFAGTRDGHLVLFNWRDDRVVVDGLPRIRASGTWIYEVDASPDELGFVVASRDGHAFASDEYQFPTLGDMAPMSGEISGVARISGGVLTSGADGKVRYWLPAPDSAGNWAMQTTLDAGQGWVWDVAAAPDGDTFASAGADGTVKLWSLSGRRVVATLKGHRAAVSRIRFSPDGSALASASRDGTLRVWDVASGQLRYVLDGHSDWVTDLAYSASGDLLATVGGDGRLILWDANQGVQLRAWHAHAGAARGVVFRPDGKMLITVGDDNTMRLWGIEG